MTEMYDPERPCPKCGGTDVATSYRADSDSPGYCKDHAYVHRGRFVDCEFCTDEHLDRHCRRCGFDWREEVITEEAS